MLHRAKPIPRPDLNKTHSAKNRLPRLMLSIVVIVALLVLLFTFAALYVGDRAGQLGQSADPSIRQIIIGNDVVNVPGNVIRFEQQRQATTAKRLDLYYLWPGFEGYSEEKAKAFFGNNGSTEKLIFATLEQRPMAFDMSARLHLVYQKLLTGNEMPSVSGLVFQEFRPEAGYSGEELHYEVHGEKPFVTRCQKQLDQKSVATCMRDIHIGEGLALTYRFSRKHLPRWRTMDITMRNIVSGYLVN